jgi:hypothetical protein
VLFADMVGFTSFSERAGEEAAYTLRDIKAEQVKQQANIAVRMQAERGQPHLQLFRNLVLDFARANAEGTSNDFDEWEKWSLLAVW